MTSTGLSSVLFVLSRCRPVSLAFSLLESQTSPEEPNMKTKKPNAELVWKQIEDVLAPQLRLSISDRVVYSHLLRHSRLEGKLQLRFSMTWLSRSIGLCGNSTRWAVRRLISRGILRLVQCSKAGHVIEVLLPEEIPAAGADRTDGANRTAVSGPSSFVPAFYSKEQDFLKTAALRKSIHARERGRCFYCLRCLTPQARCLDHVVPQSEFGGNAHWNLVSCCLQCNSQKGERSAIDFFRRLYRERRLSDAELADRLRALDTLAAGRLLPLRAAKAKPLPRKSSLPRLLPVASGPERIMKRREIPQLRRPAHSRNERRKKESACSARNGRFPGRLTCESRR